MTTNFSRTVKKNLLQEGGLALSREIKAEIRESLSMMVSATDDSEEFAGEVSIKSKYLDDKVIFMGHIDRDPQASYLLEDFQPENEMQANPLSVNSEHEIPSAVQS